MRIRTKMRIQKEAIYTSKGPKPAAQNSQGIRAGPFVFTAVVGDDPETGKVATKTDTQSGRITPDLEKEFSQLFENIEAVLQEAGTSMANIVETTTFVKDLRVYETFKKVREKYYRGFTPPVNAFIQVSDILGANVEMRVVAIIPET